MNAHFPRSQRPQAHGCEHCQRLRALLAAALLVTISVGLNWHVSPARGASSVQTGAASAPTPSLTAASAPPATAVAAASAPAPATSAARGAVAKSETAPQAPHASATNPFRTGWLPAPTLLYRTVPLRASRVGRAFKPLQLVQHPNAAHTVRLEGQLPPGLTLDSDGIVRGTPTTTGNFQFNLVIVDTESGEEVTQQAYALRIFSPPAPTAAASAASAAAPVPLLQTLSAGETEVVADTSRATPISYKLTPADAATLVPSEELAPTGATALPPAADPNAAMADLPQDTSVLTSTPVSGPALPTNEQLKALLAPLIDIEYPTRALFQQALQSSRCSYYRHHITEQALAKKRRVDLACPPPAPAAKLARQAAPGAEVPLHQFYLDLLPSELEAQIVSLAEKRHPIELAKAPTWSATCGCHAQEGDDVVYGLFPYWLTTEAPQTIDFSLFSRIGLMGALLRDDGSLAMPEGWSAPSREHGAFARTATRHGTELDLVLYRRDWTGLLRLPEARLDEIARVAARNAVMLADARLADVTSRWISPLLLPGWREPDTVYGGLTVFFDESPSDPELKKAFKRFYRQFALRLISEMQAAGRSYQLNFVVPDQRLGEEDGAFGFQQLADFMETAQPRPRNGNTDEQTLKRYRGTTDIRVFYLLLMGEPTTHRKVELRMRVDETPVLQGHRRVAFLQGLIPLQFAVRTDQLVPMAPDTIDRVDDTLAYLRWNFGGAGFWPVPVEGLGQGTAVRDLIAANYQPAAGVASGLCDLACPNRLILRLLLQIVLALDVIALTSYALSCRVRSGTGQKLVLAIWGVNALVLALAGTIFTCDPALTALRTGNVPLYVLIGALCLVGAYLTFRTTSDAP